MSFTNGQLAQKISDLIGYWSGFATEYANWLGGSPTGGPGSDGSYPLTDFQGNELLVKSPAKLQDDVDVQVNSASASATAAAASASAASTSETNAAASASAAAASEAAADADRIAAASSATAASGDAVTATTQANLANDRSGYASEWANKAEDSLVSVAAGGDNVDDYSSMHHAIKAAASAAAAATSETNAAASEAAAATFDPALYFALADAETVTGKPTFQAGINVDGASGLNLYGRTADHVYVSFFPDAAAPTSRKAYMGFAGAATEVFSFNNEYAGGSFQFLDDVAIVGALTATTYGGITEADLLDKTSDEDISGRYKFTNNPLSSLDSSVLLSSTVPMLSFEQTNASADNKVWNIVAFAEQLRFRTSNDAGAADVNWLVVDRTGTTIDQITFSGAVDVQGALTATSYGGILQANLLDKSAAETVTGQWTFADPVHLNGPTDTLLINYGYGTGAPARQFEIRGDNVTNPGQNQRFGIGVDSTGKAVINNTWSSGGLHDIEIQTGNAKRLLINNLGLDVTGQTNVSDGLGVRGSFTDVGQVGMHAFMDMNGGVARFGAYDYDTASWGQTRMYGTTVNLTANAGNITLDPSTNVINFQGTTLDVANNIYLDLQNSSTSGGLRLVDNNSAVQGYVYYSGTHFGLLHSSGGWALKIPSASSDVEVVGNLKVTGQNITGLSNKRLIVDANDNWLRLNNDSDFTNGVYTPGSMRVDGTLLVGTGGAYAVNPATYTTAGMSYIEKKTGPGSLTAGQWLTIATNPAGLNIAVAPTGSGGNRAAARFMLADLTSSRHEFYYVTAICHYGQRPYLKVEGSHYGAAQIFDKFRIVEGSTYDGAALQVHSSLTVTATWYVSMLENLTTGGWVLKSSPVAEVPEGTWTTTCEALSSGFNIVYNGGNGLFVDTNGDVNVNKLRFPDSTNDDVNLESPSLGNLRLNTEHGWMDFGMLNGTYCHFDTNATGGFYFYDPLTVLGNITPATTATYTLGSGSYRWLAAHIDVIHLGHASDTSITRVSAGKVEIESKPIIKHASATYNSGEVTFSTVAPSGGADGDIWFEYT